MNCPGTETIERAFPASANDELTRHIASCEECGAEWSRMESLAALVRDLPVEARPSERVGSVRDAVLASAARRPRKEPSRVWPRVALALAASLALVALSLTLWPSAPDSTYRARVVAGASARFTHSALPDEVVRLSEGTVSLDVEHLGEGERLRVVTGDAEVEVRGTSFVVEAHGDRLSWVHVMAGVVEVRPRDASPVRLGPLEHWRPAPAVTALAPSFTPPPAAARTPAPVVPPHAVAAPKNEVAVRTFDVEEHYREGFRLYMRQDFAPAAAHFERVLREDPSGPLAEDAAFQAAFAQHKLGRDAGALVALQRYLALFPAGPRAGDAHWLTGVILLEQPEPDLESARVAFESAARVGPEKIRALAEEGLESIRRRTAAP